MNLKIIRNLTQVVDEKITIVHETFHCFHRCFNQIAMRKEQIANICQKFVHVLFISPLLPYSILIRLSGGIMQHLVRSKKMAVGIGLG